MKNLIILTLLNIIIIGCSSLNIENKNNLNSKKLFQISQKKMQKGDYKTAIKLLKKLKKYYPLNNYSEQIQLDMIYNYYKLSKPSKSIKIIKQIITLNPNHKNMDYILYMYGLNAKKMQNNSLNYFFNKYHLNQNQKYNIIAANCFLKVTKLYKHSPYLKQSKKELQSLQETIAKHELSIIKYYLKKKAYVAVFNRSKNILKKYSNTQSKKLALKYIQIACKKLNLKMKFQ